MNGDDSISMGMRGFHGLRGDGRCIDKTALVREFVRQSNAAKRHLRLKRIGKTLALSM